MAGLGFGLPCKIKTSPAGAPAARQSPHWDISVGDSIRLNPGDLAWSSTSRFRRGKPNPDPAPGVVVEELDPSLFEGRLDTHQGRDIAADRTVTFLDPLDSGRSYAGGFGKLLLPPTQEQRALPVFARHEALEMNVLDSTSLDKDLEFEWKIPSSNRFFGVNRWINSRLSAINYRSIRDRIRAQDPQIDEQTLADTVEGLTDLHEILTAVIRAALADQALATGLEGRIAEMQARRDRLQDRAAKRRQIAKDVMVELDLKKLTAPDFTASIRPGTPALMVIDEAAVPSIYWEPREPRLNRQELANDLKQGAEIAGVALSNPEPVLSVRTR